MFIHKKSAVFLSMSIILAATAADIPPKPQWVGNPLGKEALTPDYREPDKGLPPLQLEGNTILADFKRIVIGSSGLPAEIFVRDENILASATEFRVETSSGILHFRTDPLRLKWNGKNSIAGKTTIRHEMFDAEIKFTVDYDYLFHYEITLLPKKHAGVTRAGVIFKLNLPDDKLCAYLKEGPRRPEAGIEAEKRRVFLNVKDGKEVAPGFCPNFWVGNTRYGLSWNFSDAEGWTGLKGRELVFSPERNEVFLNFLNAPGRPDKPLTFRFYLGITPLKTMPPNWRAWNFTTQYGHGPAAPQYDKLIYWSFWRITKEECHNNLWVNSPDRLRRLAAMDNAQPGRSLMHYMLPSLTTHTAIVQKEGKTYVIQEPYLSYLAEKNARIPSNTQPPPAIPADAVYLKDSAEFERILGPDAVSARTVTQDISPNDEFVDFLVWNVNRFAGDFRIGGIYSDGVFPLPNYRYAYHDDTGTERPRYPYEVYRRLYKRIRQVVKQHNPGELMIAHSSGNRPVPTLSLFDMILLGENYFYWYHDPVKRDASKNGDFYYAHIFGDIDNLKTELFSRQWGLPQVFLPELRGRDRKVFPNPTRGTRTMLAYTLQFDLLYWPLWCDAREIAKWNQVRQRFGMADTPMEIVEFVPYWENRIFLPSDGKVKVGYYEKVRQHDPDVAFDRSRKYLLVVSNLQFSDSGFTIALPEKLTTPKAVEASGNTILPVKNNRISVSLKAYDFALIEVTGEME